MGDDEADDPNRVLLGRINGLFGVAGWVKVYSYTVPPENILEYPRWQIGGRPDWSSMCLLDGRRQGKSLVARLGFAPDQPVADRDAAAALVGADIAVFRDELPELEDDAYYWADLVGLRAQTLAGDDLGEVTGMMETGAHDVLVIDGDRQRLVPFVREHYVRRVDLQAGIIVLDWEPDF